MVMNKEQIARFWSKVNFQGPNGCWEWVGYTHHTGYGVIKLNKKSIRVHRVSFTLAYGNIPEGQHICHHCDNTKCVNPAHLFAGSAKDNMVDMTTKGRHCNSKGELHGLSVLTEAQVIEIRRLYASTKTAAYKRVDPNRYTHKRLALLFGVNIRTIGKIITRQYWSHI